MGSASLRSTRSRPERNTLSSQVAMNEHDLDGPDVSAALKKVGGKAMPQGVPVPCLLIRACRLAARDSRLAFHRRGCGESSSTPQIEFRCRLRHTPTLAARETASCRVNWFHGKPQLGARFVASPG
jgi:hypothetical protein